MQAKNNIGPKTHISMHLLKIWMGKCMSVGIGNVLERTAKF
jgi:hypothetical protein